MRIRQVPVDSLTIDPNNANRHDQASLDAIRASYETFGQQKPIVINSEGVVIAGNGQLEAARQLGWKKIAVVESALTGNEATAFAIADNRAAEFSLWDQQELARQLEALQVQDHQLMAAAGYTDDELQSLLQDLRATTSQVHGTATDPETEGIGPDGKPIPGLYTRKIEAPIYEPKDPTPPAIEDLYDATKTNQLLDDITAAEFEGLISPGEAEFLRAAAHRHTTIDYQNVAEFYAHADAPLQALIEASALIIIDFNSAIEDGFVRLAESTMAQYLIDHPDQQEGQADA